MALMSKTKLLTLLALLCSSALSSENQKILQKNVNYELFEDDTVNTYAREYSGQATPKVEKVREELLLQDDTKVAEELKLASTQHEIDPAFDASIDNMGN